MPKPLPNPTLNDEQREELDRRLEFGQEHGFDEVQVVKHFVEEYFTAMVPAQQADPNAPKWVEDVTADLLSKLKKK